MAHLVDSPGIMHNLYNTFAFLQPKRAKDHESGPVTRCEPRVTTPYVGGFVVLSEPGETFLSYMHPTCDVEGLFFFSTLVLRFSGSVLRAIFTNYILCPFVGTQAQEHGLT